MSLGAPLDTPYKSTTEDVPDGFSVSVSGAIGPTSRLTRKVKQQSGVDGLLQPNGLTSKKVPREFTAELDLSSSFKAKDSKRLVATLTWAGGPIVKISAPVEGTIHPTGSFSRLPLLRKTATVSFSGSGRRLIRAKAMSGTVAFSSSIIKALRYPLSAAVSFVSSQTHKIKIYRTGSISPSAVRPRRRIQLSKTGSLASTSTTQRRAKRKSSVTGAVSFSAPRPGWVLRRPLRGVIRWVRDVERFVDRTRTGHGKPVDNLDDVNPVGRIMLGEADEVPNQDQGE